MTRQDTSSPTGLRLKKVAFHPRLMDALVLMNGLTLQEDSEITTAMVRGHGGISSMAPSTRDKYSRVIELLQEAGLDEMHRLVPLHEAVISNPISKPTVALDIERHELTAPLPPLPLQVESLSFIAFAYRRQLSKSPIYSVFPVDLSRPAAAAHVRAESRLLSTLALGVFDYMNYSAWANLRFYNPHHAPGAHWDPAKDLEGALQLLAEAGIALSNEHLDTVRQVLCWAREVPPAFIERFAPEQPAPHNRFIAGIMALENCMSIGSSGRLWRLALAAAEHITPASGQRSLLHFYIRPGNLSLAMDQQVCAELIAAGHPLHGLDEQGRTPMALARKAQNFRVEEMLRVAIAREQARLALDSVLTDKPQH